MGLDLFQFADVIISLGGYNAVNLDGGGSAVSVLRGQVVSKPTCDDTPVVCERPVTTAACIPYE